MGRVAQKNTKPEMIVRRIAHGLGLRFRLHRRDLPGTPDLVFPSRRLAIFVHGCFWHRHPGCRLASMPKTRAEFWCDKFEANVGRDVQAMDDLRRLGWEPLVVWECETRQPVPLTKRLQQEIGERQIWAARPTASQTKGL